MGEEIIFPSLEEVMAEEWYQTRPQIIQEAIQTLPPTKFYKIKSTGEQCVLVAWTEIREHEHGPAIGVKLRVAKTGLRERFGYIFESKRPHAKFGVFGLSISDLEPWDK